MSAILATKKFELADPQHRETVDTIEDSLCDEEILVELQPGSEAIRIKHSNLAEHSPFTNQINEEGTMQHPEATDAVIAYVEGSNGISIEQLLGNEEVWFDQTPQSEDFWLTQLPEVTNHVFQGPDAIRFELSPESVVETQSGTR